MSPTSRQLGQEIRRLREAAAMSQGELAKKAKVSREYLNRLESGKYDPTLGTLTRLARALGVKLTALLGAREGG
jgi:transcriptional regulator with XRE-family HTH domain